MNRLFELFLSYLMKKLDKLARTHRLSSLLSLKDLNPPQNVLKLKIKVGHSPLLKFGFTFHIYLELIKNKLNVISTIGKF